LPDNSAENFEETLAWIIGDGINFRDEASLDFIVITRLSNAQSLTLFSKIGDWAFVKVGTTQGYVNKDFISTTVCVAVFIDCF